MNWMLALIAFLGVGIVLAATGTRALVAAAVFAAMAGGAALAGGGVGAIPLAFGALAVVLVLAGFAPMRDLLFSRALHRFYRKALPPLSDTEQEAIDAGTVWWDGELFSGKPDWKRLLAYGKPQFTPRDQAFLDGPVRELCRMASPWKHNTEWTEIPPQIVDFLKREGFFGMIIPQAYGGLELSAVAQTEVITRLQATGNAIANLVSVPNSLGPGELLLKYGTEEQKRHYLPRLASGEELPCFALTGPTAGSDATSIPDTGVVCRGQWEGGRSSACA
jgi:acyl-CoA dehydrogenase